MKDTFQTVVPDGAPKPGKQTLTLLGRLLSRASLAEASMQVPIILWYDERSKAPYTVVHLSGNELAALGDLEAVLTRTKVKTTN